MKKILITGGPVYAYLDDVKIITNKFKGGLMLNMAKDFVTKYDDVEVIYMGSKTTTPNDYLGTPKFNIITHDGFQDYMDKVISMAADYDAVILGAAVANLIPFKKIEGKFPSHNYKPGELVPLIFQIAPRIIDMVKAVAPKTHLFGFKLLSDVPREELIKAAYGVLLDSHATTVFANNSNNLGTVYAVTKEGTNLKIKRDNIIDWVYEHLNDEYYQTMLNSITTDTPDALIADTKEKFKIILDRCIFKPTEKGLLLGTAAMRCGEGFLTTMRGKKDINDIVYVTGVDHENLKVHVYGNKKATLNAPLLDYIFKNNPEVQVIVHEHTLIKKQGVPLLSYAPAGTKRDSIRNSEYIKGTFNIHGHGSFFFLV
jgi:phosphopantothenate---cysteine ligase (CTP)